MFLTVTVVSRKEHLGSIMGGRLTFFIIYLFIVLDCLSNSGCFYFPFISDFVKDQFCDYSAYGEENQLYIWKHVCGKAGLSQWSRCEMVARLAKMVVVQMERRWAV